MRLVFLSTPPSFSVMVTCGYHPVPPILQASSQASPHRHDAPSGSLFSPWEDLQLHTGRNRLGGPCPCCFCCSSCCLGCLGVVLDEETGQLHDGSLKKTKETKIKHAITRAITPAITRLSHDNPRDNPAITS